jgi:26S proteasome regulatory subunit N10
MISVFRSMLNRGQVYYATPNDVRFQLALKHRQNRNQRQRIIVFVGSPVQADEKALVKLAKKMKKNNIAVDIINFGEEAENTAKLEAFIANVNSGDNSHIVTIPPGPHILSEKLKSTPIAEGEDGAPAGFASGSGDNDFGMDGGMDPELELVSGHYLKHLTFMRR